MSWLAQYFLNPGLVLPGIALASVPILIHILSRLRYRRVRFAAMEFLLQSDELNRRRLILEQLLLLLLRVLAVILIGLLLARLILDPSRLLMLRGASVHHVVLLDDSLSMRDRIDDGTVFDQAVRTLEQLLAAGGTSTAARVTVLLMTEPERPLLADRQLDSGLLQEVSQRVRSLQCSYRAASVSAALSVARQILAADAGVSPQVHIITDFRASDWNGRPEVTAEIAALGRLDARISVIRVVREARDNVVLEQLTSDSLAAARGVPWRMNLTVQNHGTSRVGGLRGSVRINGVTLPSSILIPDLEPGTRQIISHDVTFQTEGRQQVEVRLDEDTLPEDGRRFIVVDVTDRRPILIIDDDGQQEDAGYVAAALSADDSLTGLAAEVRTSQVLTSIELSRYDCVYLLNVRDLAADATLQLADYVHSGGGIAWFPGDQANTLWYSETLRQPHLKLFPVPLGTVRVPPADSASVLPVAGSVSAGDTLFQSPVFGQHPVFAVYNLPDSPFADVVQFSRWFQLTEGWVADDQERRDHVRTLARLRNGDPVIFEHSHGSGKVLTFLTGAGRRWSNWPIAPAAPGYVVMHLLMHPYLQKPIESVQIRELSEPLKLAWPASRFQEQVEVYLPEPDVDVDSVSETFQRLQATVVSDDAEGETAGQTAGQTAAAGENNRKAATSVDPAERQLEVTVSRADRPGVYRIRRFSNDGNSQETWIAMNVPVTESNLALADPARITGESGMEAVRIVDSAAAESLGGGEAGRELRWALLGLLLLVLVCEQLLSLRMSYHPEKTS